MRYRVERRMRPLSHRGGSLRLGLIATVGALLIGGVSSPPGPSIAGTPFRTVRVVKAGRPHAVPPAYYRPVVVSGRVFPAARSDYLSMISFGDDWHAPRLRLVNGKWLQVGVHEGIDIFAERGTPVLSMAAGRVSNVGWSFYSGTMIDMIGVDGRYYFFAHLSAVAPSIAPGVSVHAGTVLGKVGNTGYGPPGQRDVFPPHLHVGIAVGGSWVSPYPFLVRLYAATVAADRRGQDTLDRLAAQGRTAEWRRMAGRLYSADGS